MEMDKYIIIKKSPDGKFRLRWIYYGDLINGMGPSKNINKRSKEHALCEDVYNSLLNTILPKRKIKRRKKNITEFLR